MYNKRGFFGLVGIVCLIAGIFGFLSTVQAEYSKTFGVWMGSIWLIGWIAFSFIALLSMTVETKDRIFALVSTIMWLVIFFVNAAIAIFLPIVQATLSSSQMFCASLLLFVMPAIIAEDAKHGWE